MPSLLVRPGVSVRLKRQPFHVPDFLVMHCKSDRAWIRQPNWPRHIQLCVRVTQLAMPEVSPQKTTSQGAPPGQKPL
ncbi:MAG: hypothetical protein F6J95_024090 [Leptolyngbya sp. SIO1E4]|nr:hypothetical protein [Leptolyngbya sp. SIO1E4]